jgi:hypothetical protein
MVRMGSGSSAMGESGAGVMSIAHVASSVASASALIQGGVDIGISAVAGKSGFESGLESGLPKEAAIRAGECDSQREDDYYFKKPGLEPTEHQQRHSLDRPNQQAGGDIEAAATVCSADTEPQF